MDTRTEDTEVIDLARRRPQPAATNGPAAARSAVLVLPAEDDTRIVVTGPVGAATAAALTSQLDAALGGGGPVTVDFTRARIDDPVALAWVLRRRTGRGLRLVARNEGLPPTAA